MEILGKDAMKTIKRASRACWHAAVCSLPALLWRSVIARAAPASTINFQPPVTKIAEELYDLHTMMLILCTVIFVGVFGVMFYSIFAHRKSKATRPPISMKARPSKSSGRSCRSSSSC
jgi:cytochrome c oxidase subunit 2